jgi:hypothetical protein
MGDSGDGWTDRFRPWPPGRRQPEEADTNEQEETEPHTAFRGARDGEDVVTVRTALLAAPEGAGQIEPTSPSQSLSAAGGTQRPVSTTSGTVPAFHRAVPREVGASA